MVDPVKPIAPGAPIAVVGTVNADPTLGVLSHVVALGIGAVAGWLSLHIPGVTLSPETQLELTGVVVGGVVSGVHYMQARISAVSKGA